MPAIAQALPVQNDQQSLAPKLLTPVTQPIPLLSAPLVTPYSSAHTVGVLLFYYLRAGRLVTDPLTTLAQDVVPLAALQAAFCAICLPAAGSWNNGTSTIDVGKGGKSSDGSSSTAKSPARRKGGPAGSSGKISSAGGSLQNRIMVTIFSLILALSVPPVPLTVLALVLGAPLYPTSLLPHTGLLSVHVALLAFLPIFYVHGVSAGAWRDVIAAWLPFDEAGVWAGAVGCMVGGWVGAIPIALDWDREWQKWPCTVVWGVVIGWALGRLLTGSLKLGIGKRIDLSEGKRIDTVSEEQKAVDISQRKTK